VRHLDDQDLDAIGALLDLKILQELRQLKRDIVASLQDLTAADATLNDEINQIVALVTADNALITQLQGTLGSGNLTPDQQAQVDALLAQMTAQNATITAALTAGKTGTGTGGTGTTPPPTAFVTKVSGESFSDYQARVTAWNADPANATTQVTALDNSTWTAAAVG